MYITIPAAGPEPYRRLKNLSFAPETDLTLASIPVNEFRADIITGDMIPVGSEALLYDDMDGLWADYIITKSERLDALSIRVTAQSPLTWLDRWTLPAEMFQSVTVARFVELLFSVPASGHLYNVDIDIDACYAGVTVTGFCPEQTARERLHWLCLTVGALVKQCFSTALQLIPAPDVDASAREAKGALIPINATFWKPSVTVRELMRSVAVTGYENFTDTDPGEQTGLEWQTGVDEQGVTWYFNPVDWTFENEESPETPGRSVSIDGVTLIGGNATQQVLGWLSAAYFRQGVIEMDVINNGQYFPGQKVRVYADEETIYTGYIQSCNFKFGLQARSTLVISSDLEQVPSGKLTISYRYGAIPLGKTEFVLPDDEPYDVENPIIGWTDGGRYVEYVPTTPRSTGTEDTVVQYAINEPARIEVIMPPNKIAYFEGDTLDYTGMIVKVYNANGQPWTEGGLYQDGIVPLGKLLLPRKWAEIDDPGKWASPGQIIIDGELVANYLFIEKRTRTVKDYAEHVFKKDIDPIAELYREDYPLGYWYVYMNATPFYVAYLGDGSYLCASGEDGIGHAENNYGIGVSAYNSSGDDSYTYKGQTVRYFHAYYYTQWHSKSYIAEQSDVVGIKLREAAWAMVYGEIQAVEGKQTIPVGLQYGNKTLKTSFEITVSTHGTR